MDRALRDLVWRRANRRCEYCLMPSEYDEADFEVDHIIAEKHGGISVLENLALACFACNHHKGPNVAGIDPESGTIVPLFHPRLQSWHDHFRLDRGVIIGLTTTGRATVAVLEINLPHRVSHRQVLIEERVYPSR